MSGFSYQLFAWWCKNTFLCCLCDKEPKDTILNVFFFFLLSCAFYAWIVAQDFCTVLSLCCVHLRVTWLEVWRSLRRQSDVFQRNVMGTFGRGSTENVSQPSPRLTATLCTPWERQVTQHTWIRSCNQVTSDGALKSKKTCTLSF